MDSFITRTRRRGEKEERKRVPEKEASETTATTKNR